ncbi:hypothetical protein [Actinoplanes sp. GCM10030250]|uniref:hypothetical protein n=1 Tax=Actinoplanes sp. GCM10030250 TaxID=3273376 RepID=UPI00361C6961
MERGPLALFGAIIAIGVGPALWLGAQLGAVDLAPNERPSTVGEQFPDNDTGTVDFGGAGAGEPPAEADPVTRYTVPPIKVGQARPEADPIADPSADTSPSSSSSPSSSASGSPSASPSAEPSSSETSTPPTESTKPADDPEPSHSSPPGGTGAGEEEPAPVQAEN